MKKAALHLVLALLPSCFFSSCFLSRAHVNGPLENELIASRLVPGKTTAAEVVAFLGAPNEVVQLGRRSAYRYEFTRQKTAGLTLIVFTMVNNDTQSDRAWLFFDENDVLSHVGSTLQAGDVEWKLPWSD